MLFLLERFAGAIGVWPGKKMAPDQATWPATTSPLISRAPLLFSAPPSITFRAAVDFPPRKLSVETCQSRPNFVDGFPASKSLIRPDSDPGGGGEFFCASAAWIVFSTMAR